ncbi:MAG: metallophosphoesterase [Candidatus Dormiibacterota bacterium]
MAAGDLPVLIAGDVHGDLPRLFQALKPYPPEEWQTIFLGDLVDYGPFGVGALRYARERPNSTVLLGNHEVAMLWALRDQSRIGFWMSIGGQRHDLDELARDASLQEWLRERPALLKIADGTVMQHCGSDAYVDLLDKHAADPLAAINARVIELLDNAGEPRLWDLLSGRNVLEDQPARLERWLDITRSRRVVFAHKPHGGSRPVAYHDGKAINFDGGLSSYHRLFRRLSPLGATVAPLPPLAD